MVLGSSVDSLRSRAQWEVQQLLKDLHLEGADVVPGPQSNIGFLKKDLLYFIYLFYVLCLPVQMCTICMHGDAHRGQKGMIDPLELKWWTVVSFYVGFGNQTWVLYKRSKQMLKDY